MKKVTNFIRSHVQAAELEQNTQQELTFILPDNSVKRGGFERFFSDLERKKSELGIDSFGLTDTALEEVRNYFAEQVLNFGSQERDIREGNFFLSHSIGLHMTPNARNYGISTRLVSIASVE